MDKPAFRRTVCQTVVSLMKWRPVVPLILSNAIDILFSRKKEQKIQLRTCSLPENNVKSLLLYQFSKQSNLMKLIYIEQVFQGTVT
jgi:hypothetical protein